MVDFVEEIYYSEMELHDETWIWNQLFLCGKRTYTDSLLIMTKDQCF